MCICTVFRYFNLLQFILTHILKVILLAGVTGSGKTEIALRIMKQYNAHLISCDSVQIYDKLSILSNKPAELDTHTLLHFYNFKSQYDITKYVEDVNKELEMCLAKNKIPIIVGGTGFYFSKLNLEQYDVIKIFLTQKREALYERLDARCEDMILNGMLDEVKEAKREGLTLDHILGKSIGCRDGLIFLGNCENEPMKYLEHFKSFIGNFKRRTRNYARKQECWFRKTDFAWVDIDNYDAFDIIINFLNEEHVNDLQEIDTISRDINNNARKRMKTFESAESKISQQTIDDIVKNILW